MPTPYNTGKVLIGRAYQPPRQTGGGGASMERLQGALLQARDDVQQDLDGLYIAAACLAILAVPTLLFWFR